MRPDFVQYCGMAGGPARLPAGPLVGGRQGCGLAARMQASPARSPEPPGPAALKARQLRQRWAGPRRLGWVALNG
ncbi:MAG: hypothetical protein NTV25_02470, partial [Methanothrix sp.]|nr:hypothetical protein [Methanothrix sp.]